MGNFFRSNCLRNRITIMNVNNHLLDPTVKFQWIRFRNRISYTNPNG